MLFQARHNNHNNPKWAARMKNPYRPFAFLQFVYIAAELQKGEKHKKKEDKP